MAKRYHDGFYEGSSSRKQQEASDSGMISASSNSFAGLPQEVMMKPWPIVGSYLPENLNDTISGVDKQMNADSSKRAAHMVPKKV